MNYPDDEHRQAVKTLAAVFFAGVVLNLYFALPLLKNSEKMAYAAAGKLNPNMAAAGELAELPSLGPGKAQAIVRYRQDNKKVFENASDLENVKGIGEKTVEKIEQWLIFNGDTD